MMLHRMWCIVRGTWYSPDVSGMGSTPTSVPVWRLDGPVDGGVRHHGTRLPLDMVEQEQVSKRTKGKTLDNDIKAVLQALAKQDITLKEVAEAGYTYMEALLDSDEVPSVRQAAMKLAEISVDAGYQRGASTWANHYKTLDWVVAETDGFNWLEGVSHERHLKAAGKMTWDEFVANPPPARLAGKIGESWVTTLRRAITEATTSIRHAEVDGKRRNNSARVIREALPVLDSGVENLRAGLSVLEGA